ncbi:hypothetical protein KSP39_PZI006405 [Platanthera zijinensis]|uniref:Pectinesterase inhibitor domain-containing protein n=1 Tax=Platanthera zijinensis TaxID=2320716 RepID=A0AAP0BPC5_9ASPA
MAGLASALPLLLTLLISAASATAPTISATHSGAALIRAACTHAGPHLLHLCISSLSAEPPSAAADLRMLAIIAVRVASNNTSQTAAYLDELQDADGEVEPTLYQCVGDCAELYIDAAEQLDTATAAIDDGEDEDTLTWLEAAVADVASCEMGCGAAATAEIRERNDGAKKLLKIALSLAKLLRARKGR